MRTTLAAAALSPVAVDDLDAATRYLQHAANSAHCGYGADKLTATQSIEKGGKTTSSTRTHNRDRLVSLLRSFKEGLPANREQGVRRVVSPLTVAIPGRDSEE